MGYLPILTHKVTRWGAYAKTDTLVCRKEFPDIASANAYVEKDFGGVLKSMFAFSRDGMEYALGQCRVFLEYIMVPSILWSVEIEGPDELALMIYRHHTMS